MSTRCLLTSTVCLDRQVWNKALTRICDKADTTSLLAPLAAWQLEAANLQMV